MVFSLEGKNFLSDEEIIPFKHCNTPWCAKIGTHDVMLHTNYVIFRH